MTLASFLLIAVAVLIWIAAIVQISRSFIKDKPYKLWIPKSIENEVGHDLDVVWYGLMPLMLIAIGSLVFIIPFFDWLLVFTGIGAGILFLLRKIDRFGRKIKSLVKWSHKHNESGKVEDVDTTFPWEK